MCGDETIEDVPNGEREFTFDKDDEEVSIDLNEYITLTNDQCTPLTFELFEDNSGSTAYAGSYFEMTGSTLNLKTDEVHPEEEVFVKVTSIGLVYHYFSFKKTVNCVFDADISL